MLTETDLSTAEGMNPTKWIYQNYGNLKTMDPQELGQFVLQNIPRMGNFGRMNKKKFIYEIQKILSTNPGKLIGYLTNFYLKGADAGVIYPHGVRAESIDTQDVISETDLSTVEGMNPTKWIYQNYDGLKTMDPQELGKFLLQSIPHMGNFGRKNKNQFVLNIKKLLATRPNDILRYATNFMLSGMGMSAEAVVGDDIRGIASMITEDVGEVIPLKLYRLKKKIEVGTNLRLVLLNS